MYNYSTVVAIDKFLIFGEKKLNSVVDYFYPHGLGGPGYYPAHGLGAQLGKVCVIQLAQGDLVYVLHVELADDIMARPSVVGTYMYTRGCPNKGRFIDV